MSTQKIQEPQAPSWGTGDTGHDLGGAQPCRDLWSPYELKIQGQCGRFPWFPVPLGEVLLQPVPSYSLCVSLRGHHRFKSWGVPRE